MSIQNAKDGYPTYQADSLPNVSDAVSSILQSVKVQVVTKKLVSGRITETTKCYQTKATKQPFTEQQLQLKPEGQRGWRWFTIHTLSNLNLQLDDIVVLWTTKYRVMGKYDYSEYGYYEYHVVEDYIDE